jgi:putative ABC transport system ATP-binding protein
MTSRPTEPEIEMTHVPLTTSAVQDHVAAPASAGSRAQDHTIECRGITVDYPVGRSVITPLRHLDLRLPHGATALMGPSGSGKSTLLRVIAGLQAPSAGEVLINDRPVRHSRKSPELDREVTLVHQDYRLVSFLDVRDNLQLARSFRGLGPMSEQRVEDVLAAVGLPGSAGRQPETLSGGQQQRVAIARALACETPVLLADEPTGALDADNSQLVAEVLVDLARTRGVTVLVATHDQTVADRLDATVRLRDGVA